MNKNYEVLFSKKLREATILSRPNRFVMIVKYQGKTIKCFCPTPTSIGNIMFENMPCLISKNESNFSTQYTVEAIKICKSLLIGINQVKINAIYEILIKRNIFKNFKNVNGIKREVKVNKNKIDFYNGESLLEIKMPLTVLATKIDFGIHNYLHKGNYDRTIQQYEELIKNVKKGGKSIIFITYLYDAPKYDPYVQNINNIKFIKTLKKAERVGVSFFQNNFEITTEKVILKKVYKLCF